MTCCRKQADTQTPSWKIVDEKKWGIGWKNAIKCQSCGFKSQAHPSYRNVPSAKRGPDPAASKVALAVRLQDTPMGSTRCRLLLANLDIPPPARSSMQRRSDAAGQAVTELNKQDMAEKVQKIKEVKRRRGNPGNVIKIAMYGRYNSTTIASRMKPGHSMRDDDREAVHHSNSHPKQAMLDGRLASWERHGGRVPMRTSRLHSQHISPSTPIRV